MSAKLLTLACVIASSSAIATPDIMKLKQAKSEKIFVAKSESHIDFTPQKHYDKYIISVSGPNGFSKSFETDTPSLDISSLNIPEDGTFNYQVKAVTYLKEVKDTMNNGRSEDARGFISKVDVTAGKFTTSNFSVNTFEALSEKEPKFNLGLTKELQNEK